MRPVPTAALGALTGSRAGDALIVHSWLDGQIVQANLPVADWVMAWDADRLVQGQLSLTVADVDGTLAPWGIDDALGVGGPRLQAIYAVGETNTTVDVAWFRLTRSAPAESWRVYGTGTADELRWVPGGAQIPVEGDDLTRLIARARLLAPESPAGGATVLGEVRRLLAGIVPVTVPAGVVDASVAAGVVYDRERLAAVQDLLASIGCTYRMTGDGQFEVCPTAEQDPVWIIAGGDEGALVSVQRAQRIEDFPNGVVSDGTDATTHLPVRGIALEPAGPLRWDGPHGRDPLFRSSPLIDSQAKADADAWTTLRSQVAARTVDLAVTCLPHPGLQPWDWVQVACPVIDGAPRPLVGQVTAMTLRGSRQGVSPMTLRVRCSFEAVQAVAVSLRGR